MRLTGCPLRCEYCDTTYSFTGGEWKFIDEILAEVASHKTKYILVTGGEPLAQKDCLALVTALKEKNYRISIETSGEKDVRDYVGLAKIIMDIKTPSSKEEAKICFSNLDLLRTSDEIKFVICDRADYEWSRDVSAKYRLTEKFTVLFSPAFDRLPIKDLAEWILADKLNVRLQTQLHKHIWGKETTGV